MEVPDTLGDVGRARLGAKLLMQLQESKRNVINEQVANGLDADDLIPNQPQPISYKAKREQLDAAAERVTAAHADIEELFRKECATLREGLSKP